MALNQIKQRTILESAGKRRASEEAEQSFGNLTHPINRMLRPSKPR